MDASSIAQTLEAAMLICFGVAWPLNLLLMLRSRRPEGKSLCFTGLVASGYVFGAAAKVLLHLHTGGSLQPVFWLYVLNSLSVSANAAAQLYFRRLGHLHSFSDAAFAPARDGATARSPHRCRRARVPVCATSAFGARVRGKGDRAAASEGRRSQ